MMTEDSTLHPKSSLLGLTDRKITHLSTSMSRGTVVTSDSYVAVIVDQELQKVASKIQVCRGSCKLELL